MDGIHSNPEIGGLVIAVEEGTKLHIGGGLLELNVGEAFAATVFFTRLHLNDSDGARRLSHAAKGFAPGRLWMSPNACLRLRQHCCNQDSTYSSF
eukprot:scaffold51_cov70-Cylindrotheca_fusiformis.AAC.3